MNSSPSSVKLGIAGASPSLPEPPKFWTVVTDSGLRLCAMAATSEEACAKVHGAVSAWLGFEPLAPAPSPGNDNAAADVLTFASLLNDPSWR